MKKYSSQNPGGFTLLIILGVIGFLLILLTGIFKVVTLELKDTKNMDYYLKSKGAAEAGQELALLKLKENNFGYDEDVEYNPNSIRSDESTILVDDLSTYHPNKDISIGYEIDSKASSYTGTLESGDFQVIPMFVKTDITTTKTKRPSVEITSGTEYHFIWNIIGEIEETDSSGPVKSPVGISGNNEFEASTLAQLKKMKEGWVGECIGGVCSESFFEVSDISIEDFLRDSSNSYLTIFNKGNQPIEYTVSTNNGADLFTKPVTTITSQAKIGEIKQNIQLEIFNDKYFDVLRYSLFDTES